MTPRSLFNIILKVFGFFFLREIVLLILQLISSIEAFIPPGNVDYNSSFGYDIASLVITLFALAFFSFIIYKLMLKTNSIIDLLKLDKGFNQEEFSFNLSSSQVLTIALIVVGGIILTDEIPNFCRDIYQYFQMKSFTQGATRSNYSYIIISAVKIILALLIIWERRRIVTFAELKQKVEADA